ncbi:unnamed protein product, partial [Choristocarpus tenellus]
YRVNDNARESQGDSINSAVGPSSVQFMVCTKIPGLTFSEIVHDLTDARLRAVDETMRRRMQGLGQNNSSSYKHVHLTKRERLLRLAIDTENVRKRLQEGIITASSSFQNRQGNDNSPAVNSFPLGVSGEWGPVDSPSQASWGGDRWRGGRGIGKNLIN